MTKTNFKKAAVSWIVSWEFSVISDDNYTLKWRAFFLRAKDHATY